MFIKNLVISFDFGIKNIGVAIGECITYTARPLNSLRMFRSVPDWLQIDNIFNKWNPGIFVVGLPLDMNGNEQYLSFRSRMFSDQLRNRFCIKVVLHDERLSTVEARSLLFYKYGFRCLNKKKVHSIAAMIILQSWFNEKCSFVNI